MVTAPFRVGEESIERFLVRHSEWVRKATERMRLLRKVPSGRRAYLARREVARLFVHERVLHWNQFYQFKHGRIAIKNTKTVWGSCSRKGNLNFSFALTSLPSELADYVVVHELCHLQEHNHSRAFWDLVARTQPDYQRLRRELKTYVL